MHDSNDRSRRRPKKSIFDPSSPTASAGIYITTDGPSGAPYPKPSVLPNVYNAHRLHSLTVNPSPGQQTIGSDEGSNDYTILCGWTYLVEGTTVVCETAGGILYVTGIVDGMRSEQSFVVSLTGSLASGSTASATFNVAGGTDTITVHEDLGLGGGSPILSGTKVRVIWDLFGQHWSAVAIACSS